MSDGHEPSGPHNADDASPWLAMLRQVFGPDADRVIEELRANGIDPEAMMAQGPATSPAELQAILGQVQSILATPSDGSLDAGMASQLAHQTAASDGDPSVTAGEAREVRDALSVAELWLDVATDFAPSGASAQAWNRTEWADAALPTLTSLAGPVAASVTGALTQLLRESMPGADELPDFTELPGMSDAAGPGGFTHIDPTQLIERLGNVAFGMQLGQAVGTLAREAFGSTDLGVPLSDTSGTGLVPRNVNAFAQDLDVPTEEVRLYLAAREAAFARLFHSVPWLRGHLTGLVETYARGVSIDVDALEEAVRSIDPTDPQALQSALSSGVFGLQPTAEQQAVLLRLETALALVEGWVTVVVEQAVQPHLPHTQHLGEMITRRRASGGPSEQAFASLVGLELRPRRARDAAKLWRHVLISGGNAAREAVWGHPDLLPTARDLDDPAGFLARRTLQAEASADMDRALAELLDSVSDDEPTTDSSADDTPPATE